MQALRRTWSKLLSRKLARLTPAAVFIFMSCFAVIGGPAIMLPVEVMGEAGTTASVSVDVATNLAQQVNSLFLQIHGLEYDGEAGIKINSSPWVSLSNQSVTVSEPAKSYGGIGGGFATLKLSLPVQPGTIVGGRNTIQFRFNHSDGVVSGFRVLAFNLITADGQSVCPPETFVQDNPDRWAAPLDDAQSIQEGRTLWQSASLVSSPLPAAQTIRAHCSDCHAQDGRDLKYFNFSNGSIITRAQFHGLSLEQGRQIASYIRSLPFPHPGRPWNPPYQPGPGLDAKPASDWAAGAGLQWALEDDQQTLGFIFTQGAPKPTEQTDAMPANVATGNDLVSLIQPAAFHPDGNLNPREIPIAMQMPDWNHWLPRVHPLDAWGADFAASDFSKIYRGTSAPDESLSALLSSSETNRDLMSHKLTQLFAQWSAARDRLLKTPMATESDQPSPNLTVDIYSTQLWQLVKTWELTQQFSLEGGGSKVYGATAESRSWLNTVPAATAPAAAHIPDGPDGMSGSALVNEYFNNTWYELQILLNDGHHQHQSRLPVDWVYVMGRFLDLQKESHHPEPGRALVTLIKAFQSTDPGIGPDNYEQGWRPGQSLGPTVMISPVWTPVFAPLSGEVKQAITEAMLRAWLEKNTEYPVAQYFSLLQRQVKHKYTVPEYLGAITGDHTWAAAAQFQAAGVDSWLVQRLVTWGKQYTDTAARFSY